MLVKRNLFLVLAVLFAFLANPAWSKSQVKAGCEPIAEAYLKQAIRLSGEANRVSDWLAKPDYAALCTFYTTEYPEAQTAYIDKIKQLKQKNVCWTKEDDTSLSNNQGAMIQSAKLWHEYCKKAGIVPGNERKTEKYECIIKNELEDYFDKRIAITVVSAATSGRVLDSEWQKSTREELYLLAEMNRLIVVKADDCPTGRILWHPPQKLK